MDITPIFVPNPKICISYASKKGRGVFALGHIDKDEVIEHVPVLTIPSNLDYKILPIEIGNYIFSWTDGEMAIALGYGSFYNHSYSPNSVYSFLIEDRQIEFIALRNINPGEEITVNYNNNKDDKSPLWFEVLD